MTTGLFIGRFQPFHNAHLRNVRGALKEVDMLVIGIGSSDKERTQENPFSAKERKEMISAALDNEGISSFSIVELPDFADDGQWMDCVRTAAPDADIVFVGNDEAKEFFEKRGCTVRKLPFVKGISGTIVRGMMRGGKEWEPLVPPAIHQYIFQNNLLRHVQ